MGLYNFKPMFVAAILNGEKRHTIRAERKHPDKPGDVMHLYTGLRTKKARLLMRAPCIHVEAINITGAFAICIDGNWMSLTEREALALRDGFASLDDMQKFWLLNNALPFVGNIFHWNPSVAKPRSGQE